MSSSSGKNPQRRAADKRAATSNGDHTSSKSVRFAFPPEEETPKRTRRDINDDEVRRPPQRIKRPRLERPNQDEEDDVDDWDAEQDQDEPNDLPSTHDVMEAKRQRRLSRQGKPRKRRDDEEENETHIDAESSLLSSSAAAASGQETTSTDVKIEPFNMDAERTDGSGYFDGDTYVFRKRDVDEEPDAWLESLGESKEPLAVGKEAMEESEGEPDSMDQWSREDLYAKIIPLLGETETVLQGLARYGGLLKRHKTKLESDTAAKKAAQTALNDLTEAANALLLQGDVDVYEKNRADMKNLVSIKETDSTNNDAPTVQWEYRGNQDGQIHGPYTTQEMVAWTQAGYFIGPQAVQIRTISKGGNTKQKSTVDDMLSDLMEDENSDETSETVRGDWMSSNDVKFSDYS